MTKDEAEALYEADLERAQARMALTELVRRSGSVPDPLSFLGKLVRFNHLPQSEPSKVLRVNINGLIEIEGFSGQFAPHLFTKVGEWQQS